MTQSDADEVAAFAERTAATYTWTPERKERIRALLVLLREHRASKDEPPAG